MRVCLLVYSLMCVLTFDCEKAGLLDTWHHMKRMFKVWCLKMDLLQTSRKLTSSRTRTFGISLYTTCIRMHAHTQRNTNIWGHTVSIKCWHLSPINHPLVTTGHFHELHNTAACGTLALWDKVRHCVSACVSQPCQPLSLPSILLCHCISQNPFFNWPKSPSTSATK